MMTREECGTLPATWIGPSASRTWSHVNRVQKFSLVAALLVAVVAPSIGAQTGGTPQPFEAASIKPNTSGDSRRMIGPGPGGRFTALSVGLRQLIAFAFGVSNSRSNMLVIGGPGWTDQQRFEALRAARAAGAAPAPAAPSRPPQDPSTIRPRCGLRESPGRFAGDGITTAQLAAGLAPFAGRVVLDRTGLQEYFDLDLEWTTEPRGGPDDVAAPSVPTDLSGLFTALKEQLGLKLDDAHGPVEVVVIDSVSPLIPN